MKINCWDYIDCGRELSGAQVQDLGVCRVLRYKAYHRVNGGYMGGRSCWQIVGTFPEGKIRCSHALELGDCTLCEFFKLVKKEEGADFVLQPLADMAYWRTPLDLDNVEITHGIIHINIEQCKGCEFCVEYCPKVVLKLSTDYNRKGYHYPMVEKQGSCVNCNLCEMICPEFAIFCVEDKPRPPLKLDVLGGNERP